MRLPPSRPWQEDLDNANLLDPQLSTSYTMASITPNEAHAPLTRAHHILGAIARATRSRRTKQHTHDPEWADTTTPEEKLKAIGSA